MRSAGGAVLALAILAAVCADPAEESDRSPSTLEAVWRFEVASCQLRPDGSAALGLTLSPPPGFQEMGLEEFSLAGFDTIDIVGADGNALRWSHEAVRLDRWRMNLSIREDPLPEMIQVSVAGVAAQARRLVAFSAERLAGLEGQTASEPFGTIGIDRVVTTAEGTTISVRYPHIVLGNGALEGLPDSRLTIRTTAATLVANSPGLDGDEIVADQIFEAVEDPDLPARFEVEFWDFFVTDLPPLDVNLRSCGA